MSNPDVLPTDPSILVTGASGRLGGAVLDLLASTVPVGRLHALVRGADARARLGARGIDARIGDYDDAASLEAAFRGIDRLVFVSSPALDPAVRLPQHQAVLAAARAAGVGLVVYTSAFGAAHDPGHAGTEALLEAEFGAPAGTEPSSIVLRNGFYTEPFVQRAVADARSGAILSAAGAGVLATASVRDLAEAAARVVVAPPASKRMWELRGRGWTYPELAREIGAELGRAVELREVSPEDVGALGVLHALAARGVLAAESDDLGALLGREPRDVAAVVREELFRTPRVK